MNAQRKLKEINSIILELHSYLIPSKKLSLASHAAVSDEVELAALTLAKSEEIRLQEQAIEELYSLNTKNLQKEIAVLLSGATAFKSYFAKFAEFEKEKCSAGAMPIHEIKALVIASHNKNKQKIAADLEELRSRKFEGDKINFLAMSRDSLNAVNAINKAIDDLKKAMEIERVALVNTLKIDFLASFDDKEHYIFHLTLRAWYQNLSDFIYSKIISCPVDESNPFTVLRKVEPVVGEEPKIDLTIETLTNDILAKSGIAEKLRRQTSSDAEYKLVLKDYAYRLAMNMHFSFKVTFQEGDLTLEQEFDGICKRTFNEAPEGDEERWVDKYVIIERKTNIGTGEGLLQTVFTQGKVNAKMEFFRKNSAPFAATDIILGRGVLPEESESFSGKIRLDDLESMNKAAKEILAEALNSRHVEFIFNNPGHDVTAATKRNYFDGNTLQKVMLRVSNENAGDEHEILKRLNAFYQGWLSECTSDKGVGDEDELFTIPLVSPTNLATPELILPVPVVSLESIVAVKKAKEELAAIRKTPEIPAPNLTLAV